MHNPSCGDTGTINQSINQSNFPMRLIKSDYGNVTEWWGCCVCTYSVLMTCIVFMYLSALSLCPQEVDTEYGIAWGYTAAGNTSLQSCGANYTGEYMYYSSFSILFWNHSHNDQLPTQSLSNLLWFLYVQERIKIRSTYGLHLLSSSLASFLGSAQLFVVRTASNKKLGRAWERG